MEAMRWAMMILVVPGSAPFSPRRMCSSYAAKKLGGKITFVDAIRFEKGEGIEKKQENFAEEIAKMVKG